MNSVFVTSAANKSQWPDSDRPEIVVVGRSNVGKSSFINALTNKKHLAYVGNTPGKTRLINFFSIDNEWMLVDVPGYGYARMSKQMLRQVGQMMDEYFTERKQIKALIQLIDARHPPTRDDLDMIAYLNALKLPIIVVATKVDKIPKTRRARSLRVISQALQLPLSDIYPISSTEKTGLEPVLASIQKYIK